MKAVKLWVVNCLQVVFVICPITKHIHYKSSLTHLKENVGKKGEGKFTISSNPRGLHTRSIREHIQYRTFRQYGDIFRRKMISQFIDVLFSST